MPDKYHPYKSEWDFGQWDDYAPRFSYRVVRPDEFPKWLPKELTNKFNSAMVAASGNYDCDTFLFLGYRIDGDELDEHPYIVTFDHVNDEAYAGLIEHIDYEDRTTKIPDSMLHAMEVSGVSAEVHLERHPDPLSGHVDDLIDQGLITGFKRSIEVQRDSKRDNSK